MVKSNPVNTHGFVLNCRASANTEQDWTYEDAINAGVVDTDFQFPDSVDLRRDWWKIQHQGNTGACVGYATAYGVLHWHYVNESMVSAEDPPSARFIWMANKETDDITTYPSTFLETDGTQTKLALRVAQKYGCVLERELPMDGSLSFLDRGAFYARAAKLRITSYHNLGLSLDHWRHWLAFNGPILTRLNVDKTWDNATSTKGFLNRFYRNSARGGHAVCLVGYDENNFIVRNSWGEQWGDGGYAYASNEYTEQAFTEAYGAVV